MFNRSEILTTAWATYRRDVFKGWGVRRGEPFNRQHFAYCLRMAWAVAKELVAKAAKPVVAAAAPKIITCPAKLARLTEIKAEMTDMQYGDRINWDRYRDLSAERARIAA